MVNHLISKPEKKKHAVSRQILYMLCGQDMHQPQPYQRWTCSLFLTNRVSHTSFPALGCLDNYDCGNQSFRNVHNISNVNCHDVIGVETSLPVAKFLLPEFRLL